MPKLVITNGDTAVESLKAGGVQGHFLPWRDGLHDGPVPASPSLDLVSDARAGFLSSAFGLDFAEVRGDFAERDAQLQIHIAFHDVDLWFEHDLYDQLQLAQLLAYFAHQPERLGLNLVQADDYIALLPPDGIAALTARAAPVTTVQLEAGRAVWEAFTAETPERLAALAEADLPSLPFLPAALSRALAELPAPGTGLSLTEARILDSLVAGPKSVSQIFTQVLHQDEARFLADLAFFLRLDALAFAAEPLIAGLPFRSSECQPFTPADAPGREEKTYGTFAGSEVRLTPAGEAALGGGFDHVARNGIDRWLGGTHLMPGAVWRYDRDERRLLRPH